MLGSRIPQEGSENSREISLTCHSAARHVKMADSTQCGTIKAATMDDVVTCIATSELANIGTLQYACCRNTQAA